MQEHEPTIIDPALPQDVADYFARINEQLDLGDQSPEDMLARSAEYRDAITEGSLQLRRLATVHQMAESARDALSKAAHSKTFWGCASAAYIGASMLLYGTGSPPPGIEPDLIDLERLKETLPLTAASVGTGITAVLAAHFDRGFARLTGMSEALSRLEDGAQPGAPRLIDRLTNEEREAYAGLLTSARQCQSASPAAVAGFLDAARATVEKAIERHAGTPSAHSILDLIHDMGDALKTGHTHARHDFAPDLYPGPSTPSL